jgi:hypothetical protein
LKEKAKGLLKAKEAADRMKQAAALKGPVEAGSVDTRTEGGATKEGDQVVKPLPSAKNSQAAPYKKGDSPVKVSLSRLP